MFDRLWQIINRHSVCRLPFGSCRLAKSDNDVTRPRAQHPLTLMQRAGHTPEPPPHGGVFQGPGGAGEGCFFWAELQTYKQTTKNEATSHVVTSRVFVAALCPI
jgi:hypothetical protein